MTKIKRPTSLSHYRLRCRGCDGVFENDRFILECPMQHDEPALLVPEYRHKRFEPDARAEGLFRYSRWLPPTRALSGAGSSVTYKSEKLKRLLGLSNVWVVFNGYWPEKGATFETVKAQSAADIATRSTMVIHNCKAMPLSPVSCVLTVPRNCPAVEAGPPKLGTQVDSSLTVAQSNNLKHTGT